MHSLNVFPLNFLSTSFVLAKPSQHFSTYVPKIQTMREANNAMPTYKHANSQI